MKWIAYIILIVCLCLFVYGLIVGILQMILGIKAEDPYRDKKIEVAKVFLERMQIKKKK